jgi:RecA-family ATPase
MSVAALISGEQKSRSDRRRLIPTIDVFRERCEARAILVEACLLDLHTAVDELQTAAIASGLVDEIGQDVVQKMMGDVFVGKWSGHGAGVSDEKSEPPPMPEPVNLGADPIPPRDWQVQDRIPARNVTLLSGEGAVGKSILLLQLAAATVLERDWIGTMPKSGPVIYLSCEDDEAEIRRRLEAIASHYQSTRAAFLAAGLKVYDYAGKDATLGQPDRSDHIQPTALFSSLKNEAVKIKPKLVIIDTLADAFAGNENNRAHTRQFIGLMRGIAIDSGAAVVLASHPSLTGKQNDSGISGSTAWHNGPRARGLIKQAPAVEDDSLRVLEWKKNNYGPVGERILLRWKNGLYLPEPRSGSFEQMAADARGDTLFIDLLRRLTKQGRNVSDKSGTSYAPTRFAEQPEAKKGKLSNKDLREAMTRLFAANRIKVITEGPPSHPRTRIVEVSTDLPPPSTGVCVPPPYNPPFGGRAKGSVETDRPSTEERTGSAELRKHFRIVGPAPGAACVQCHQADGSVLKVKPNLPGAKTETLHEACAELWFERTR